MGVSAVPQLLLNRHYLDIEDWGREVGWDTSFTQIDSGALRAKASAFGTTRCVVTRGEFSRSIHQIGTPPTGMLSFGLPDDDVKVFRWCGKDAVGGDILNFNLSGGFEGTTPSGFSGFVISFSQEWLREIIESEKLDSNLLEQTNSMSVWNNATSVTGTLLQQLSDIYRGRLSGNLTATDDFFSQTAATRLLKSLSHQQADDKPENALHRRRAVRRAMEWISSREDRPISISRLSRNTGASTPTLYRGFMEEFGIGPKKYLNLRRLTRVRAELVSADPGNRITEIANRWGFWHMGQFAADYRKHFGELPSETLAGKVFRKA